MIRRLSTLETGLRRTHRRRAPRGLRARRWLGGCGAIVLLGSCAADAQGPEPVAGDAPGPLGGDAPGVPGDGLPPGSGEPGAGDPGGVPNGASEGGVNDGLLLAGAGVVASDASGGEVCVPLCLQNTDPAADPDGDDRAREAGVSCVIPGSVTGSGPSCVVGQPIASAERLPGVVVLENGSKRCAPLCVATTTAPAGADWSYEISNWAFESGQSCVIPGTITQRANQECVAGLPLPPERQIDGVVIVEEGMPRCAPLCVVLSSVADDPDADGWFYENNSSCVIPGTDTALANQACTTGGALPESEPRPGLLLADGLAAVCRPVCEVVTTPSDATAPDWGYEQNSSCVLSSSPTAAAASRDCTFGGELPVLVPPPLTGSKVAAGFYVQNGRLFDAYGADFVIRGVNNAHIWYDISAQYEAYAALDAIAGFGTNTIRVVWETNGPALLLREVLHRIVELDMVPMVELHDATGSNSRADLVALARYYASPEIKPILDDFREYLLVNVANEWSGNDFVGAYQEAIGVLRSGGVSHTLVIDANGFGQNGQVIVDNASTLLAADPQRNLLFSVHMYERFGSAGAVDTMLDGAVSRSIPLIVGEFGWQHSNQNVAWERILERTGALGIGYVAWSWLGNEPATAQLDMATDWNGPLTEWGQDVMTGAPGNVRATSRRASIFD